MKVYVFRRGIEKELWLKGNRSPKQVAYCGYLEVDNPFKEDLWNWCNWSCRNESKPKECANLLITHCNSDVAYCIDGVWYSHGMKKFASFSNCYKELVGETYNKYFNCVWSISYGFENNKVEIVTPENIGSFINR